MALRNITKLKLGEYFKRSYSAGTKLVVLQVDDKTGYATMEMQRPPVNSLNLDLITDITTGLEECKINKCRGVILTSKNEGVFSGGLDILEMYKPNPERIKNFWIALQDMWIKLYGTTYPTVALINGHSPAGGCLLTLCTEYRIMYKNFTIGLNETKLGLSAPPWFVDSMKNVIGFRQTEIALTSGHMFTTQEALKVGLIDESADNKNDGISKAEAFLNKFSKISPVARATSKSFVRGETIQKLISNRDQDLKLFLMEVENPQTQNSLEMYLEAMKKKKSA